MFLQRSAIAAARRVAVTPVIARGFATSIAFRSAGTPATPSTSGGSGRTKLGTYKTLNEVKVDEDLIGPGAEPGTVASDLEQATGLERLEILGKMEGIDVFDMRPLDSSRIGTLDNPIMVRSAGNEQLAGCTGSPADSHVVIWLGMSKENPVERCPECGSVYKMDYVGSEDHGHHHHPPEIEEPKTFADFVKPEYRYR